MKITTNRSSKILNNIVLVGIVLTLLLLIGTPLVLTAFFKTQSLIEDSNIVSVITAAIYICAIPYVYALILLKKLCELVANKNPFSPRVPVISKKIAMCAFSEVILFNGVTIFLCYFYDMYLYALTIFPCIIVSFVSIAIGFMSLVSSKLFEMAIEIKDENDKTI